MKYLIVGIDVSRSSIAACFLLEKPSNPRDDYFDADIEVFHSNLENLNRLKTKIESFQADKVIAICEPTGMNYAQLWMNKLGDWGCEVRMISNSKLPNYRAELMGKEGKSGAKTDDIDAFAIACWYFDKASDNYLKIRDPLVAHIKNVCLRLEHLNRVQSPIINRMRQELAWQCPEIALVRSAKLQDDLAPLLWGWLAGRRKSKKYDRILEATIGSGIESQTRWAAKQYCEIEEEIFKLKNQLTKLIENLQFEEYRQIFNQFWFRVSTPGLLTGSDLPDRQFSKRRPTGSKNPQKPADWSRIKTQAFRAPIHASRWHGRSSGGQRPEEKGQTVRQRVVQEGAMAMVLYPIGSFSQQPPTKICLRSGQRCGRNVARRKLEAQKKRWHSC